METTMDLLREGDCARILSLRLRGAMRRRLLDFGMIEGTCVRCLRISPSGDPVIYRVRGTMLALRRQDSSRIAVEVEPCR
ncbi:MAG: FeoA domain-containing protein [Oscillospiraceae bacterium]|nr:FeoA domain-containing protein [Oscillospiraceae bacterium]